jgi:hypothetical protein
MVAALGGRKFRIAERRETVVAPNGDEVTLAFVVLGGREVAKAAEYMGRLGGAIDAATRAKWIRDGVPVRESDIEG